LCLTVLSDSLEESTGHKTESDQFSDGGREGEAMKRIFLLVFCCLVISCASPVVQRQAKFIESEFAPYDGEGTSIICGHAFLKTAQGNLKYGSGNTIMLFPVTTYTRESFHIQFLQGKTLSKSDPQVQPYLRKVRADADGRFCFENIPSGEYYLVTAIVWLNRAVSMPGNASHIQRGYIMGQNANRQRGGWAHAQTVVKPHETAQVIVTR